MSKRHLRAEEPQDQPDPADELGVPTDGEVLRSIPPSSTEGEVQVLRSIMTYRSIKNWKYMTTEMLEPSMFGDPILQSVFEKIRNDPPMWKEAVLVGATVLDEDEVEYLRSFASKGMANPVEALPKNTSVAYMRRIIDRMEHQKSINQTRDFMMAGIDHLKAAADDPDQIASVIETLQDEAASLEPPEKERRITSYGPGMDPSEMHKQYLRRLNQEKAPSIPLGFDGYDNQTGGISAKTLNMLSAPTGRGKTTAAFFVAYKAAISGFSVRYISLEMDASEMEDRLLALVTGLPREKLSNGLSNIYHSAYMSEKDVDVVEKAWQSLGRRFAKNDGWLHIDDTLKGKSAEDAVRRAAKMNDDLVVIDYIGLMDSAKAGERQWQIMAEDVRKCKLALRSTRTELSVILLAQEGGDGEITNSKHMIHHLDNWWSVGDEDSRNATAEEGALIASPFNIKKARTGRQNWRFFTVVNVDNGRMKDYDPEKHADLPGSHPGDGSDGGAEPLPKKEKGGGRKRVTAKQREAIRKAHAEGVSQHKAAEAAGVSSWTVNKMYKEMEAVKETGDISEVTDDDLEKYVEE